MGQAALPAAVLGSSIIGGLTAPEGQELSSFEGRDSGVGPTGAADEIWKHLQSYLTMALTEAQQPVSVRTTVPPLPSFGGGGLPFDIAAPAIDPNRADASLRTLQPSGYQTLIPELFGGGGDGSDGSGGGDGGTGGHQPPQTRPQSDSGEEILMMGSSPEGVSGTNPPQSGYNLDQFGAGENVSDLDQAEGAIDLLLQQLQGGGGPRGGGPTRRVLA